MRPSIALQTHRDAIREIALSHRVKTTLSRHTVLKSKNQGLFHFAQRGSKGLPDLRTPKAM